MTRLGDDRLPVRFWEKVEPRGECWIWTAAQLRGYGRFHFDGRNVRTHRLAYETLVGPIPPGLVLDHLCRVPACVNPAHLDPVTDRENSSRSPIWNGNKIRCVRGHVRVNNNIYVNSRGERICRQCDRERGRTRRALVGAR